MRGYSQLPEGYAEKLHIDIQKDKKLSILLNVFSIVIAVTMIVIAVICRPYRWELSRALLRRLMVLVIGMIAYLFLQGAAICVCMKIFKAEKIKYGFTGLYVYAGSENTFFDKVSYLIITWAPFIVWGVVFLLLNLILPEAWFWVAYLWQVCNVSSAVGAFYISFRVIKMPRDVFVRDTGLGITLYTKN